MYYKFIPIWKTRNFIGCKDIIYTKFASIEDGLVAAEIDGTALREENWNIFEYSFLGLLKKKISLRSLYNK